MLIRPAKIEDAPRMVEIKNLANEKGCVVFYTPAQIKIKTAKTDPAKYFDGIESGNTFVVEEADQPVGFIQISDNVIIRLFVDPKYQGLGIGTDLINFVIEKVKPSYQTLLTEASLNAVSFYEKFGFVKIGESSEEIDGVRIPYISMKLNLI